MKRMLLLATLFASFLGHAQVPGARLAIDSAKVDADMQQVLDAHKASGAKPLHTLTPAQARDQPSVKDAVEAVLVKKGQAVRPAAMAKVEDRRIPGWEAVGSANETPPDNRPGFAGAGIPGPAGPLDVRVYTPVSGRVLPGVVYFHGGGFVVADLDAYDASARAIARESGAVVVSVHYRQAPEHRLPAAHEDASAAFQWVRANARQLGIDATRIAVAGESAGANLAAFVANAHKDHVVHQLLIYPFVSTDLTTQSHVQNGGGEYLVGNPDLAWFWKHALGEGKTGDARTVLSRADAAALRGAPPATVMVASLDPLLDEGRAYAKSLDQAGVVVQLKQYEGVTHEFFGMGAVVADARTAQKDAGVALRRAFAVLPAGKNVGQ